MAVCLPTLGAVLTFYLGRIFLQHRDLIAVLILVAAYLPVLKLFEKHELMKGFRYPSGFEGEAWKQSMVGLFLLALLFEPALIAIYITAIAFILYLPLLILGFIAERSGLSLPRDLFESIAAVSLILASAWVFSGLRAPVRLRTLGPDVLIGVWRHRKEVVQLLGQAAAGLLLVGAGASGLLFASLKQSFFAAGFAGLMLALSCYSRAGKEPIADTLIRLGRARCHLRLGKRGSARADLREIEESPPFAVTGMQEELVTALWAIEGSWREHGRDSRYEMYDHIRRAADLAPDSEPNADIWQDTVRRTWSLPGMEPVEPATAPEGLYAIMRDPALPAWKRVVAGQALARAGDPRLCHDLCYLPDEPFLGFVEIPEGYFKMGEGRDLHDVFLPTYYMSRHPVTQAQFRMFGVKTDFPHFELMKDRYFSEPVDGAKWNEALAFCEWLGEMLKRLAASRLTSGPRTENERRFLESLRDGSLTVTLPSEAEWEKSARGTDGRLFPWGDHPDSNAVNCWENGIGGKSPIGCFPSGASVYGVEDLLGAGEQWTRSLFRAYPYQPSPACESFASQGTGVLRGGETFMLARAQRLTARATRERNVWGSGWGGASFRLALCSPLFLPAAPL